MERMDRLRFDGRGGPGIAYPLSFFGIKGTFFSNQKIHTIWPGWFRGHSYFLLPRFLLSATDILTNNNSLSK